MAKIKLMIESTPIEKFTKKELNLYFDNENVRSLVGKIVSQNTRNTEDFGNDSRQE